MKPFKQVETSFATKKTFEIQQSFSDVKPFRLKSRAVK